MRRAGFTLIELLVTIGIIAVLAGLLIVGISAATRRGQMTNTRFLMSSMAQALARFTRTLGTLVSAGVPILEAVLITRDTCGNYVFEKALNRVHDSIREGEAFAVPLRESKVVDSLVVNMIDVGEETGDMDVMLTKIADNYDEEVDVAVGSLLSLLEPFMVIILGGIIGGIVLALFLPLVSMIESVSGGGKK